VRLENTVVENDVVENRQQPVTNSLANALPATGTTHKVNQSDRPDVRLRQQHDSYEKPIITGNYNPFNNSL
jgi:hypothetical protein